MHKLDIHPFVPPNKTIMMKYSISELIIGTEVAGETAGRATLQRRIRGMKSVRRRERSRIWGGWVWNRGEKEGA
jgi:hypothetical protein